MDLTIKKGQRVKQYQSNKKINKIKNNKSPGRLRGSVIYAS